MYKVCINFNDLGEFDNFGEAVASFIKEAKKISDGLESRNLCISSVIEWEGEQVYYTHGLFTRIRALDFEQLLWIANALGIIDNKGNLTGNIPEISDENVEKDIFRPTRYMERDEWKKYLKNFYKQINA